MSDPALHRIGVFSRAAWGVGALGVMVAAFFVVPQVALVDGALHVDPGQGLVADRVYPYYEEDPVRLELVDGRLSGDERGGWLPFPADSEPLAFRMTHEHDDYVNVFQTADAASFELGQDRPENLEALWDPDDVVYATPALTDGRLWFSAGTESWDLVAEPVESTPLVDGAANGSGDALLSYRGDALSARFSHSGPGFLRVTLYAPELEYAADPAVNDVDDFSTRASWRAPGTVLFRIESTGGEWSVDVDE
ncbi:hypothetical protein [Microbacterium sp.]|uniref:hypothetical protein n=1 Tax=Microbacterium sp. TaxID=51671 RepID=UPI00281168D7|nr:hypothetical protein [Microbacterium sp.]